MEASLRQNERDLAEVSSTVNARDAIIGGLDERRAQLLQELDQIAVDFETYKNTYRAHIRAADAGRTFPELRTADGTVYQDVTIRSIGAAGIDIRHQEGFKRVLFEELSDELKDHYQYDPDHAMAELAAEEQQRRALAQQEIQAAQAARDARQAAAPDAREQEIAALRSAISAGEVRVETLMSEVRQLTDEIRRENEKIRGVRRTNILEPQLRAKQAQLNAAEAELMRLKSRL
jgi:anti-sigma28 factor (negative regulator of flagellin synthesis)